MDRWTNIVESLLKNDYKQRHKSKPIEMTNVAAGTLKRLKGSLRDKKKSRCTEFDNARNLSKSNSPVHFTEAEKKLQKRKEQLMKWKEERQQKKQIAAEQKKKPFVVGIVHPPLTFAPPPPVPKCLPSTSGRITRSQTAQTEALKRKEQTQSHLKSFAPKNAVFHPKLNIATYPVLNLDVRTEKKSTTQTTIKRAVEVVAKKTSASKPPVTRSLATKLTKNVKIVMPVVRPQNLKGNNSNKGDKSTPKKVRGKPKRVQTPRRPLNKHQHSLNKNSGIPFPSQENKGIGTSNSSQEQDDNTIDMENVKCDQNATYDLNVTPKNLIPKSESSSEEKLKKQCLNNSILTPEQIRKEAERISPCVILSRGKDNARRELKQKLEEGLFSEIGNIESVHHFRQQLDSEIIRMTKLCEIWDEIYEKEQLPESVKEQILSATGQARLLMSQKFQQFSGLVERCAAGEECVGGGLVTPTDLQGFWDMLFIQVENIDLRFIQLEKLKQREWTEDEKPKQLEKKPMSNKNVKKQNKPAAPSRLREMIAVARKAFKERNNSTASVPEEQKANCVLPFSPSPLRRRFSSMLLTSGTPRTPSSDDKHLISSEAQRASARRSLASYAMLRASQISKSVEIEGINPLEQTPKNLTPINLNATPAKSILKLKNNDMSERKLTKTVLFNNHGLDTDTTLHSSITDDGEIHTAVTTDICNQTDENIDVQSQSKMLLEENEITECISINTDAVEDTGNPNSGTIRRRNKKKSLPRQEAFDEDNTNTNKIMTRRRRQSEMADTDSGYIFPKAETEKKNSRSSKKKKALQEIAVNIRQSTDLEGGGDTMIEGKSARRRQKVSELERENMIKITPRTANRKIKVSTATEDDLDNFENILCITPRRSSRKRNSKSIV